MAKIAIWIGAAALTVAALGLGAWAYNRLTIETPAHEVVAKDGAFELRRYPAMVVAETDKPGARRAALREGFRPLARYIFASERPGEKIAMTAPVLQAPGAEGWRVAFVMPAEHARGALPAPASDEVRLTEWPATIRAALRFPGAADDALLAEREAALRGWMAERGLAPLGPAIHAYYDDPMTPGFLRRNEILIEAGEDPGSS
jgi:hypothetical protein